MRKPNVFISYAREDEAEASRVYRDLERIGAEPWIDKEKLLPGTNWKDAIRKAIQNADFVVALLSQSAVRKTGYVQRELRLALELLDERPPGSVFLIPVRLDDCRPPYISLQDLQWVDLFTSREEGIRRIAQAMGLQAAQNFRHSKPVRLLHLADLHFAKNVDHQSKLQPLVADIRDKKGGLGFESIDFVVISGDLTQTAASEEFKEAAEFVTGLLSEFGLSSEQCVVVPGNHDVSWEQDVYRWTPKRRMNTADLKDGAYLEQGAGYLVRDDDLYPSRFKPFSESFYFPLMQRHYPLQLEEQCIPRLFTDPALQFITLNSSWEVDEWFGQRSGIHPGALSRGLAIADREIETAVQRKELAQGTSVLRLAVLHHPVTGNDRIKGDGFMERLGQAEVRLYFHGHVHENRADLFSYLGPYRMHVVGAGSFGSSWRNRPESTPRLYNVLEVAGDQSFVRVHTRAMHNEGGAWSGWAIWPGDHPTERRTFYEIHMT